MLTINFKQQIERIRSNNVTNILLKIIAKIRYNIKGLIVI
jgi:hypothetical protein